LKETALNPSGT
jgi:hypothetical protein